MPKALITGVTGSGGSYLAEYLINNTDCEVFGIARWHSTATAHNVKSLSSLKILECDLTDLSASINTLKQIQPDYIFHLASHANVHVSFKSPIAVIENNVKSTINLLEAIHFLGFETKLQFCGTSEVYGEVQQQDLPIKETYKTEPVNVYAVSKLTQEKLCYAYWKMYGIPVILTRMFTYINPRRSDLFATSFAQQIVNIEKGKATKLKHGNLTSVRNIIDVRDAMSSYWYAIHDCKEGEPYNIGGNATGTVGDILKMLVRKAKVPIEIESDSKLIRPVDITLQIPDLTKFHACSSWRPKYSLDDSLNFLLDTLRSNP